MADRAALLAVAARLGIAARHTDALGKTSEVSDEALTALIGAFGFSADPIAARRELAEEKRRAPFGLDPMCLVQAEEPAPSLPLRLPPGAREIAWSCRLEDGIERCGGVKLDGAPQGGRYALPLPAGMPLGYHRLALSAGGIAAEFSLVVAPDRCHLPAALMPGAGSWGLGCQLYGLRRADGWGIGDFTDLATLGRAAGARGAAALGVNPLHALFAAEPLHFSPYSPSSRTRINPLYIDVTAVPGFAEDEAIRELVGREWFALTRAAAAAAPLV
ncbi:MAG TPA: 4-alpha-glucanotransferase, partial [Stellaceae bacterium]|nr:4-alpha-glucanotransferase [Stellaceae bacterium]